MVNTYKNSLIIKLFPIEWQNGSYAAAGDKIYSRQSCCKTNL